MDAGGVSSSRSELLQRVGHEAQLGGTRHVVLGDGSGKGVAAIDVSTGMGGLHFTVLPDRGMDLAGAAFKGINLCYLTPNGMVHPAYYDGSGLGWLHTFTGGLLTTCGLTTLGGPGKDGDDELGLHGRYACLPASRVQDLSRWVGDTFLVELRGTMTEAVLFGHKLRLTRTIRSELGQAYVEVADAVENIGYAPAPFTILYHVNAGYPLLDADSFLALTAERIEPHCANSAAHMASFREFAEPTPGFEEQNFLFQMGSGHDGLAHAGMINRSLAGGIALDIAFDPCQLPFLNEWKMMGQGDYVVGIEPCNAPCANRAELRRAGLLPMLAPGECRETGIRLSVIEGAENLARYRESFDRDPLAESFTALACSLPNAERT